MDDQNKLISAFVSQAISSSTSLHEFTVILAKTLGASAEGLRIAGLSDQNQAAVLVAALTSVGKVMSNLAAPIEAMMLKSMIADSKASIQ